MSRACWGGIGFFTLIVWGAGAAGAADLAVKAPPKVVPPADWTGFYLGLHGGYGWGDASFDNAPFPNGSPKGGVFGGHAGYNWQYGSVVTGLEVDFSGADIKDSATYTTAKTYITGYPCYPHSVTVFTNHAQDLKTDELASARGRLGYTVLPSLLAYGTAGLGWGHSSLTVDGVSSDADNFGWVAGAGLEYKVFEHVLVRAEYLHYDFAKVSYGDFNARTTVDVARGGLSYQF
jgi:outer membrane immunogenic protein